MGARGPAPTPTDILRMNGSWRADRNKDEPRPAKGKPRRPRHLSAAAKRVWARVVRVLDDMGVLTTADGSQVERYCVMFVRWRECEAFIAKHGISYPVKAAADDAKTYMGHLPESGEAVVDFREYPQLRESHRLDKALKQIEASFGLTPSARSRITVGGKEERTLDPLEQLLGASLN